MPQQQVFTDIITIAAGGNGDLTPPAGFDMEVTLVGSSVWVGVPPLSRPDVDVGLFDALIGPSHLQRAVDVRGWMRRSAIYINNGTYLRFTNPGAAPANIAYSARLIRLVGAARTGIVQTAIATIAAAGTLLVRPAAQEDWVATDFTSDQWLGVAPGGFPNLTVQLTNGTIAADILRGGATRLWCPGMKLYINNTWYLLITNTAAVPAVVGFCAKLIHEDQTSIVRSEVQTFAAGLASVDFRPAIGEEWYGEIIGASGAWLGVPPAGIPDVTAHIWDGLIASQIMSQVDARLHENEHEYMLDRDHYMRVTDTSNAVQNVAFNGVLTGRYAT